MKTPTISLINQKNLIQKLSPDQDMRSDDLIIYFINSTIVHIGKVGANGKIESKWDRGPIFKHSPLMTPLSYGSDFRYYRVLDQPGVAKYLTHYKSN